MFCYWALFGPINGPSWAAISDRDQFTVSRKRRKKGKLENKMSSQSLQVAMAIYLTPHGGTALSH